MPYQFTTSTPLAASKSYVESKDECYELLKKSVKLTNQYRKNLRFRKVNAYDIEQGARILFFDTSHEKVMSLGGKPIELTDFNLIDPNGYERWFQDRQNAIMNPTEEIYHLTCHL